MVAFAIGSLGVREKISKIRFSKTPKLPAAKAITGRFGDRPHEMPIFQGFGGACPRRVPAAFSKIHIAIVRKP